jgi:lipopolysaccharide export system permease protein
MTEEVVPAVRRYAVGWGVAGLIALLAAAILPLAGLPWPPTRHGAPWVLGAETLWLGDDRLDSGREREMNWETGIDPQLLAVVGVKPDSLSATGLWSYIAYLEGNELDADRYRIAFWFKLVVPVAMVIMALLAVPFLFGQLRSTGAGQRLMIGLLVGIVFYLINITLANTGAMFGLPPAVVAWTPTTLLAIAAFWAVRRI